MSNSSAKQRLLEAAIVAVNENGEASVRIDDLLNEVGVTAPTLYHHFGNREGLMLEVQAERFSRVMRADFPKFIEAVNNSKNEKDLRAAVRLAFTLRDDPARLMIRFQRLNALGAAYARPELAARMVTIHDELAKEVAAAMQPFQDKGILRKDIDLAMLVAWYNGAVVGKLLVDMAPSSLDTKQWAAIMSDALEHLLFG